MSRKLNIREVRKRGLDKGFYLNSDNYPNSKALLNWSCKAEWHSFRSRWNTIDQGKGCPHCSGKAIHKIGYVRKVGFEKGFYLNSEVYENNHSLLDWSCKIEWHRFRASYSNINRGYGCPHCAGLAKLTIENVRKVGFEKGFYLNSEVYSNCMTKLDWSCRSEWHNFEATWNSIDQGHDCPICSLKYNKWEDSFYKSLLQFAPRLQQRARGLLKNKRFHTDVWDPINRKALELDGDYWHKLPSMQKSDARKNQEYEEEDIKFLRIKYSEWEKDPKAIYQKAVQFFSSTL